MLGVLLAAGINPVVGAAVITAVATIIAAVIISR
jgi:hypothetical protein